MNQLIKEIAEGFSRKQTKDTRKYRED